MYDSKELAGFLVFTVLVIGMCLVALDRDGTRKAEIVKLQMERGCK